MEEGELAGEGDGRLRAGVGQYVKAGAAPARKYQGESIVRQLPQFRLIAFVEWHVVRHQRLHAIATPALAGSHRNGYLRAYSGLLADPILFALSCLNDGHPFTALMTLPESITIARFGRVPSSSSNLG